MVVVGLSGKHSLSYTRTRRLHHLNTDLSASAGSKQRVLLCDLLEKHGGTWEDTVSDSVSKTNT